MGDLLRDRDFFHASVTVRGDRQRSKGQLLGAQRYAEIALLKREGWAACCIPQHAWDFESSYESSYRLEEAESVNDDRPDEAENGGFPAETAAGTEDLNKVMVLKLLAAADGYVGWRAQQDR